MPQPSAHDLACAKVASYDRLPKNRVIASQIMNDLARDPSTDYEALVSQLMPLAVARAVSSTRTSMRPLADELRQNAGKNTGKQRYQPSAWVKHAQNAREAMLDQIYPDANHERKRLALFTANDLDALITRLATKRDAIEAQRVRFDALRDALARNNVETVADLPDDVLATAIDR